MINIKPDGLEKQYSNKEFMETDDEFPNLCLACNSKLEVKQDLYDVYSPLVPYGELLAFAEKNCTMEAILKSCPNCSKLFMEMEIGDYDFIALKEVEIK